MNNNIHYTNYYPSSGLFHASLPLLMGTRFDALLFGGDRQNLESVWAKAEEELFTLDRILNRFDKNSEVSKVNTDAQFSSVQLSDVLWDIILDCRRYYDLTDGFFDVTLSDFGKIIFMDESHSIQFDKYGLSLDFGGYAKGYALKCVRKLFEESGIVRALVDFGNSSILAIGTHPHGNNWPVCIEDPFNGALLTTIELCDNTMSVSGNTPANVQHIVTPQTSNPVVGHKMVAVVSDNPVDAEVLTTAWIASGESGEPQWMKKFNIKNTYILK